MIYTIGALVSFVFYSLVGLFISKKVKNLEDYYVSGRNASTLLIVGSLVASYLSTVAFMGDAGFSYDGYAIPLLIMSIFVLPGYIIGVLFFGRYLRRSKALTLPEYFGERFNSQKVRIVAALTLVIGITAYLVAVTQGAGLLFSEITGINYTLSLVLITAIYTIITFSSGAKGVLVTDTIMFLVFTIATFLSIPYILNAAGGLPEALVKTANLEAKPNMLSWHGITGEGAYMGSSTDILLYVIIIGIVWGFVIAVSPWQTSRYLMAKNEHVAIRSSIIATIILAFIYLFLHITMLTVNSINPSIEPSERVFIWSVMNLVPTWIGVIAISGILAAALSSSSTFLQLIGNSISKDLLKNTSMSDKQLLRTSRIVIILVSVISLIITIYQPPAIFWISVFAATLFAASWGPVAFASVLSNKVTKAGAFWSITAGFVGVVVTEIARFFEIITLPIYLNSAVFGGICSLGALIIGSKLTSPTKEEIEYHRQLMILPEDEYDKKAIKQTKRYPKILIGSGVLVILITFIFYYIPVI
ncbi:sodium:solute symporter family protein [Bacillus aerolatus]|uniref:Sodium:solute symporter family protein n=1 Tax=Bacillus aerolatus TaxID=2653354 RepID=A0A6I1FGI7_9BACI|nr:sodium:solute symporter family protein [Bacillus aerolatus]KAB7707367.1 sodium:solute symporter family protein [Bacillus aerolatus]